MVTPLKECTTYDQGSVVSVLWTKGFNAKDIHKKMFSVYGEKWFGVKRFTTGSRNVANVSLITKMLKRRCGSG
jgi:hypothetical protein